MKQILFLSIILPFSSYFINAQEALQTESSDFNIISRIIGGKDADIINFPYQASIRLNGNYICSASSISDEDVLAAAHCFGLHPELFWPYLDITVHTGTSSSQETGIVHRVKKVTIHDKWTGNIQSAHIHDIAHIKLKDKIEFDKYQQKLYLPNRSVDTGMMGFVTGWGVTAVNNDGQPSERLQSIQMRTLKYTDCQFVVPYNNVKLRAGQFCAYQLEGHGCAKGDGGAPLVINNMLFGIHSWRLKGCCAAGKPEFFTDVFAERKFIVSAMVAH